VTVPPSRPGSDPVWIFGYGSLIWRPGFPFRERVPALLSGYHRAFCRYSFRHRGTPARPGLVVGLREGGRCLGIAYGVAPAEESAVLAYLDEREGAGYLRRRFAVALREQDAPPGRQPRPAEAWSYLPDPAHPSYFGELDSARAAELVATGRGESGTALDYLEALLAHLERMGAEEPVLSAVLAAAARLRPDNGHDG